MLRIHQRSKMVLAVGLFLALNSHHGFALSLNISQKCRDLFAYTHANYGFLHNDQIHAILDMPSSVDHNIYPRPSPYKEVQKAFEYVSKYVPPPHREDSLSLAQHRAYVLKTLLERIAHVYPVWTADVSVRDNGDFYFTGSRGHFILISAKDGSVKMGNVFRQ